MQKTTLIVIYYFDNIIIYYNQLYDFSYKGIPITD